MGFKNINNILEEIENPPGFSLGPFVFTSWSVYFYGFLFARVSAKTRYLLLKKKKLHPHGVVWLQEMQQYIYLKNKTKQKQN